MKHSDFKMGMEFSTAEGSKRWRVTDIGTRTIIAVRIRPLLEDDGLYDGPPYAAAEYVFDEEDIVACKPGR